MPTTQILRTVKDFARLVPSPLRHISPVTHNSHCELWPSVRPRILFVVELAIAEMACVSRNIRGTFHVPSGVPVQRSISERDCSHPLKKSLKLLLQTLRVVESYPFTKFDKIPLINFADFSSL